jgi:hypothetical protein
MQTTTTTTVTANFDAFTSQPEIKKALQLSSFAELQKSDVNQGLVSIRRQVKIGAIIAQSKEFLKTQTAALNAYGITGKIDEILSEIYGYKRAYVFMLIAANNNADKLPNFEAYISNERENGAALPAINLPLFAQFCAGKLTGEQTAKETVKTAEGIKIEYNGKKFVNTAKVQKSELTLTEIDALLRNLFTERKRLRAAAALLANRTEVKANESAKKASAKVKSQPAVIA